LLGAVEIGQQVRIADKRLEYARRGRNGEVHTIPYPVLCVFIVLGYCLPSVVAFTRQHRHLSWICLLNITAAWTVVGWLLALCWALTAPQKREHASHKRRKLSAASRPSHPHPVHATEQLKRALPHQSPTAHSPVSATKQAASVLLAACRGTRPLLSDCQRVTRFIFTGRTADSKRVSLPGARASSLTRRSVPRHQIPPRAVSILEHTIRSTSEKATTGNAVSVE
jgi:hypothetical protein